MLIKHTKTTYFHKLNKILKTQTFKAQTKTMMPLLWVNISTFQENRRFERLEIPDPSPIVLCTPLDLCVKISPPSYTHTSTQLCLK